MKDRPTVRYVGFIMALDPLGLPGTLAVVLYSPQGCRTATPLSSGYILMFQRSPPKRSLGTRVGPSTGQIQRAQTRSPMILVTVWDLPIWALFQHSRPYLERLLSMDCGLL